jgi:hypothetical protein
MLECIFTTYLEEGKKCDRDYKCDGCEVQAAIKRQVELIMSEKLHNQVNATNSSTPPAA